MKIIKTGSRPTEIKEFKCEVCGTIFEADNTEYKNDECKCPICFNVAQTNKD